jgi:sec-independent protein translocase protein TatA
MPNIGIWEILLIVLVLLLVFGPKRIPQIGRSLGRGLREFKETVTDQTKELKEATVDAPKQFKAGLNPFKADERSEDAAPSQPQESPPPAAEPAAVAAQPQPDRDDSSRPA